MASELRKPIHIARLEVCYQVGDKEETFVATYRDQNLRIKKASPFGKDANIEEEWVLSSPVTADEMIMLSMFNELLLMIKEGQDGRLHLHSEE